MGAPRPDSDPRLHLQVLRSKELRRGKSKTDTGTDTKIRAELNRA